MDVADMDLELVQRLDEAALRGMTIAVWADVQPDRVAVQDPDGTAHSFAATNANANRLVRLLRARGLGVGDSVALVCSNRVEFVEVLAAALRSGIRLTPVNWHLSADEIASILQDCEARAVIADARVATVPEAVARCPGLKNQTNETNQTNQTNQINETD